MKNNRFFLTAVVMAAAMLTACAESDRGDNYNYLSAENVSESDEQSVSEEFEDVFAENSLSAADEDSSESEIKDENSKKTVPDVTKTPVMESTTEVLPVTSEETKRSSETGFVVTEAKNIEEYIETNTEKYITLIDAPYISQDSYPTGCELVSTSMLLKYYGFEVSALELADKNYIELAPLEKADDGTIYCADPNKAFIGDPHHKDGFGCYSGAIINALSLYLSENYFDVADLSGISLNDLCMEYIDFGEPVLVWATINMMPSEKRQKNSWIIKESGEEFYWLSNEHCMLLVGYDDENFYFHDPQRGAAVPYARDKAQQRYEELGCQAVTIRPWC